MRDIGPQSPPILLFFSKQCPGFRDDDAQDGGGAHRRHLLRLLRLFRSHPVLQPVPGADHHLPGLRAADDPREGAQEERVRGAAGLAAVLRVQPGRVEAVGVLGDVISVHSHREHRHKRLLSVQPHGRVDLLRLPLLLLRDLLDHRLRGPGHLPGGPLSARGPLPGGQLRLHRVRIVLHLQPLQRHLHSHQAIPQLAHEDTRLFVPLQAQETPADPSCWPEDGETPSPHIT
ncbi:hypothetical protein CEXT_114061 [Caerostris extrusa]|uniref:Uncharacterized protein n=1 Tax=Caerostris extrusa TaxID=172846 RepID=A0AAV4RFX4_CAEEX|nr:hypothetical protein CEXT_114061 [Caerostris extrusa]